MQELLIEYINLDHKDLFQIMPIGATIVLCIIMLLTFIITFCIGHFQKEYPIIVSVILGIIYTAFIWGMSSLVVTSYYWGKLREEKICNIIDYVIENNIDLQITDKYMLYEGEVYAHELDNIDSYVIMDKDGNLIKVQK